MATKPVVLVLMLTAAGLGSARAETDWSVAATTWKQQLRTLYEADMTRRLCGVPVSRPVRSMMRTTIRGLEQALGGLRQSGFDPRTWEREAIAASGGRKSFCAPDSKVMAQTRATLAQLEQKVLESGIGEAAPSPPPVLPSPTAPTPVMFPDISLIQNCRKAVTSLMGKRASNDTAFWNKYETCVTDQGAGWF